MTKALNDILRQPKELQTLSERLLANGGSILREAADLLKPSSPILVVGIGSSYNAALAIACRLQSAGLVAIACDASELLHYAVIPEEANVILLSRSGRSVEIVLLLDRLERAQCRTLAITNTPESPLGIAATCTIDLAAGFDHNVSFTMYTALVLAGGLLAAHMANEALEPLGAALVSGLHANAHRIPTWRHRLANTDWTTPDAYYYFLARGPSVASCNETRLLWEEAAKAPATALTTGGFRHGPQECISGNVRVGLWLDPNVLNNADRRLVADLKAEGVSVMCIGTELDDIDANLVLEVEPMPAGWQFLVDILPAQLAAEHLAALRGEDPDEFRHCPYIIEAEAGLSGHAVAPSDVRR